MFSCRGWGWVFFWSVTVEGSVLLWVQSHEKRPKNPHPPFPPTSRRTEVHLGWREREERRLKTGTCRIGSRILKLICLFEDPGVRGRHSPWLLQSQEEDQGSHKQEITDSVIWTLIIWVSEASPALRANRSAVLPRRGRFLLLVLFLFSTQTQYLK